MLIRRLYFKGITWLKLIFWNIFLSQKRRSEIRITCRGKGDGAGAQAISVLSTQLFCQALGFNYLHTPFQTIEHNYDNDPAWESKWESFFNLGFGEQQIPVSESVISLPGIHAIPWFPNSETIYALKHCHEYANVFPNRYTRLKPSFSQKYSSNPKTRSEIEGDCKESNGLKLALHIRRGDVLKTGRFAKRYTDNQSIIELIQNILDAVPANLNSKLSIQIFSQGNVKDFSDITQSISEIPISLHLNECVFETFHALVKADILVMSRSTFSYMAAMASSGVKLYDPFYHRPLRSWVVCDGQYRFDQKKLKFHLSQQLNLIPAQVPETQKKEEADLLESSL